MFKCFIKFIREQVDITATTHQILMIWFIS